MIRLFEKKSVRNLKRLNMVPTQYDYSNFEPVEPTSTQKSQLDIKRKSKGYTHNNNLYFQVELTEYQDNSNKLVLTSNLVDGIFVVDYINQCSKILGEDINGEGQFYIDELTLIDKGDEVVLREYEVKENGYNYSIQLFVARIKCQYQIEVNSIMY